MELHDLMVLPLLSAFGVFVRMLIAVCKCSVEPVSRRHAIHPVFFGYSWARSIIIVSRREGLRSIHYASTEFTDGNRRAPVLIILLIIARHVLQITKSYFFRYASISSPERN